MYCLSNQNIRFNLIFAEKHHHNRLSALNYYFSIFFGKGHISLCHEMFDVSLKRAIVTPCMLNLFLFLPNIAKCVDYA